MNLTIKQQTTPLSVDSDGAVRVAATRVTLDTVVACFEAGATPEEISQQYPSLDLASVYAALAYYLRNEDEVNAYLAERQQQAERARRDNVARSGAMIDLRSRLLGRRSG